MSMAAPSTLNLEQLDQLSINTIRFPVGRRRAKGQQWPPGPAAGRRADGLRAVDPISPA